MFKTRGMIAFLVTTAVAAYLFSLFGNAVADGLDWREYSDGLMVAPDLVIDEKDAQKVPDFVLYDRFGKNISLEDFASVDLLIVNVWNSGCPVCEEEIPALSEMDRRLASVGNIALITITTDSKWEEVRSFFPLGTDLRVLFDPEEKVTGGVFKTEKFPETFIIDKNRKIRVRFDGQRQWYSPEMLRYISSFL